MQDQTPSSLSDIEILDVLQAMKDDVLNTEAENLIRQGGKSDRQEAHKQALLALHHSFETKFIEAVVLALHLNSSQAKKIRYKKDRVRILKARGIDYMAIDGAETAQVLSQIAQAILREDARNGTARVQCQQGQIAAVLLADSRFGQSQSNTSNREQGFRGGSSVVDWHGGSLRWWVGEW